MTKDRIFAVSSYNRKEIVIYDREGRWSGRIGRDGDGPGEFRDIHSVVTTRDSVYVASPARVTVLDAEGTYVRLMRVRPGLTLEHVPLPDGGVVLHQLVYTPKQVGLPLHRFGPDGTWLGSFGEDGRDFLPQERIQKTRRLAWNGGQSLWTFDVHRYAFVELNALTGDTLRAFRRDVEWFPEWTRAQDRARDPTEHPPYAQTLIAYEDPEERLWIVIGVPDPDLYDPKRPTREWARAVLEVIDPSEGRVRYRGELPWGVIGFPAPGILAVARENEGTGGEYRFDLLRVTLVEP